MTGVTRCSWCGDDAQYVAYHDQEWGIPVYDDQTLFEMLTLEAAQAGLSWLTILRKRENYRQAFAGFDIATVAAFSDHDYQRLMADAGIVRNKLKVSSTINNAKVIQSMNASGEQFGRWLWSFVDHKPVINQWKALSEVPASTAVSDQMSKALKKRGFRFVGSTICYAFMQATGMVNDHVTSCFRHPSFA